jgi:hypothetical protein
MQNAWTMTRDHWIHVGGSIAINEAQFYPPGSYFLTGEYVSLTHREHHHAIVPGPWEAEPGHRTLKELKVSCPHELYDITAEGHRSMQASADWGNHPTGELCGSSFWAHFNQVCLLVKQY